MVCLTPALLALTLSAGPVAVPHFGFKVEATDGGVVVTDVDEGGVAHQRLQVGWVLDAVQAPSTIFFNGRPVADALAAMKVEPGQWATFRVVGHAQPFVTLRRPLEPVQTEYPIPLTVEEAKQLTPGQYERYRAYRAERGLPAFRGEGESIEPIRVTLVSPVAAVFDKPKSKELVGMRGGGASDTTLNADVQVSVNCWGPRAEWVKLNLPTMHKEIVLRPPSTVAKNAWAFKVVKNLELWRLSDAVAACESGHAHAVPVDVELKCGDGKSYTQRINHLPLEVRCDGNTDAISSLFAQRETVVTPSTLREGREGQAKVCVRLQVLPPKPLKLTPVLLDEKGEVAQRFPVVQLVKDELPDEVEVELALPTQQAGTLKVAFESESWQGEKTLNRPATVVVEGKR